MDSVGKRISHIRKERGYTQEKLAELANISVQFLSDIENNKKSMTITTLRNIADSLSVTTDYIVYGRPEGGDFTEIQTMLDTISDTNKKYAEQLLTIFIEALHDKSE